MRTLLGLLLALTLLLGAAGCGGDAADRAADPSPTEATGETGETGESTEPRLLTLVSRSDVGGEVSPRAVSLGDRAAIDEFGDEFEDARMAGAISQRLDAVDIPPGLVPAGAVVAIGCEAPEDVTIDVTEAGVEVTAPPVKSDVQCLVPVTTVAIVAADPSYL